MHMQSMSGTLYAWLKKLEICAYYADDEFMPCN